ncbi:MAG TPA: hypothetical protein VHD91_00530 [Gaiellaceae bacterium]|nr:hypothetical protein [Gaiellaceae bacterium]
MRKTGTRLALSTLAALSALLVVGVATASADGGGGGRGALGAGVSVSKLVTAAASQLNVSRSTLVTAIHGSADTYVSSEQSVGDITSSRADDLTASADDNLDVAYRLSQTATVASNLSITTDALNTGFAAARKAIALAQVAAAQTAGDITSDQATTLTTKINARTFPGYKSGVGGGLRGLGIGLGIKLRGGGSSDDSSGDGGSTNGRLSSGSHAKLGGFGHRARHGRRG